MNTSLKFRSASAFYLVPTFLLTVWLNGSVAQTDTYPVPPEAQPQDGVPRGRVLGPFDFESQIFPGTTRQYGLYVPANYDKKSPPCLMVVQDGMGKAKGWRLTTVLDNLIHSGDIPPQLGIFVSPGIVPAANADAQPRFNRSFEYDGLGDRYARFLVEELLPEVRKTFVFSDDPNDRCIAGSSSGAICALTAAWERPDQFRRVFSTVGTYVGLRGGNEYPTLIRKTEPKPIRIFLQDGSNDLDLYGGSWWNANQTMLSAFRYAGYDVKHVWGEGGHNNKHGAAVLPEALKWLWRDYPNPVVNVAGYDRRTNVLLPGEDWELVSAGHAFTEGPAVGSDGCLYFSDVQKKTIHKVDPEGVVSPFDKDRHASFGMAFGPDNHLYACVQDAGQVRKYDSEGNKTVFIDGVRANDIVFRSDGSGYVTEPSTNRLLHFHTDGSVIVVDEGMRVPSGLVVTPDQSSLLVSDTTGRFVVSFRILPDGKLTARQEYGWLHVTDDLKANADGMAVDSEGRIWVTTELGIQILDQPGRVHLIVSKPQRKWLSNIVFAGKDRDVLYATCSDSVYRRRFNVTGIDSAKAPVKPPKPRL